MFNNVFVALLGALASLATISYVIWIAVELNQEYKQRFVKIEQRLGDLPVSADPSISRPKIESLENRIHAAEKALHDNAAGFAARLADLEAAVRDLSAASTRAPPPPGPTTQRQSTSSNSVFGGSGVEFRLLGCTGPNKPRCQLEIKNRTDRDVRVCLRMNSKDRHTHAYDSNANLIPAVAAELGPESSNGFGVYYRIPPNFQSSGTIEFASASNATVLELMRIDYCTGGRYQRADFRDVPVQ